MSVEVLGGEIGDVIDLKEVPRIKARFPKSKRRPLSASAVRRSNTGTVPENEPEEEEDVYTRLYKGSTSLPRDADFLNPDYLRSIGFDRAEIRHILHRKAPTQ